MKEESISRRYAEKGTRMRDVVIRCSGRTCRGRCLDMKIFGRFSSSSTLFDCISNQHCHENRPALWRTPTSISHIQSCSPPGSYNGDLRYIPAASSAF